MDQRRAFVVLLCVIAPIMGMTSKYMDNYCGLTTTNYDSILLRLSSNYMESKSSCVVTIKANNLADSLLVRILAMGLDCGTSSLDIYDGSNTLSPPIRKGICGSSFQYLQYHSSQKYMTFSFHSVTPSTISSFKILITEYHTGVKVQFHLAYLHFRKMSRRVGNTPQQLP